jgi:hypothetical protein
MTIKNLFSHCFFFARASASITLFIRWLVGWLVGLSVGPTLLRPRRSRTWLVIQLVIF